MSQKTAITLDLEGIDFDLELDLDRPRLLDYKTEVVYFNDTDEYLMEIRDLKRKYEISSIQLQYSVMKEVYNTSQSTLHNIANNTHGKINVPTLHVFDYYIEDSIYYCPKCKKSHSNIGLKGYMYIENGTLKVTIDTITCNNCNSKEAFNNTKAIFGGSEIVKAKIRERDGKINFFTSSLINDINKNHQIFYTLVSCSVTYNTKTGYTYTHVKGKSKKDSYFINSTYNNFDEEIYKISSYYFLESLKNIDLNKIDKDDDLKALKEDILDKMIKGITDLFNEKVQENFDYEIPKLNYNNLKRNEFSLMSKLKIYNRYPNINNNSQLVKGSYAFRNFKYRKLKRSETNPLKALIENEGIKLGKKTSKLLYNNQDNEKLMQMLPILYSLESSNNINILIKNILKNNKYRKNQLFYKVMFDSDTTKKAIKTWKKYRSESYITKAIIKGLFDKSDKNELFSYMLDTQLIINNLEKYDIDIDNIVKFKKEKDYHNEVVKFYNSPLFEKITKEGAYKRIFNLDKNAIKLEDSKNNIFIAKNRGVLLDIGKEMNICVGGYDDFVEKGHCNIFYLTDNNGKYLACLEIKKEKVDKKEKFVLVQAKLKYNEKVSCSEEIFTKVEKWCKSKKIKIQTFDMK